VGTLAGAALLTLPLLADGFNACTLPQKEIRTAAGVERPISKAYDAICVAVLPPACRDYTTNGKPCAYRACLVPDNLKVCPNGDPLIFTADSIEPFVAKSVKPIPPTRSPQSRDRRGGEADRSQMDRQRPGSTLAGSHDGPAQSFVPDGGIRKPGRPLRSAVRADTRAVTRWSGDCGRILSWTSSFASSRTPRR
jgi:hypothetical protein